MNIVLDKDGLANFDEGQYFGYEVMDRLPKIIPDGTFGYLNDRFRIDWPGEELVPSVAFNIGGASLYVDEAVSTVSGVFSVDERQYRDTTWWPFVRTKIQAPTIDLTGLKAIVVPHATLREAITEQFQIPANFIKVVGYALPPHEEERTPADTVTRRITREVYGAEKSYFFYPLYGDQYDNVELLLKAFSRFRQRCKEEVRLVVGPADETRNLPMNKRLIRAAGKTIRQHPLADQITFLPEFSPHEHWKIYSSARAILYPSLSTRFPLEILRAWHARVPILAGDVEVLGGAGAQVRCTDYESVAEGMLALVTTPFLASGLVESGARRLAAFSWDKVAENVAKVLAESVDK